MTKALDDIIRQPDELSGIINRLMADSGDAIDHAVRTFNRSAPIMIVGIGGSYNAAIAVAGLFQAEGMLAFAADAAEILHYAQPPHGINVMLLSRSGMSIEIIRLLDKLKKAKARTVAVTNALDSPLAKGADTVVHLGAAFDHSVSFTMYSGIGLAGGLVTARMAGTPLPSLTASLLAGLEDAKGRIPSWRRTIAESAWARDTSATYFLARGSSLASCHAARLLWEEVAKSPATALPTGGFRHGSQEFLRPGVRLGLWLDPFVLNAEDRGLAAEIKAEGALVMCIGTKLGGVNADLALEVCDMPKGWQFLVDIIPAQLVAEHVAVAKNEDPDNFRFCSFVVQAEAGLRGLATTKADR